LRRAALAESWRRPVRSAILSPDRVGRYSGRTLERCVAVAALHRHTEPDTRRQAQNVIGGRALEGLPLEQWSARGRSALSPSTPLARWARCCAGRPRDCRLLHTCGELVCDQTLAVADEVLGAPSRNTTSCPTVYASAPTDRRWRRPATRVDPHRAEIMPEPRLHERPCRPSSGCPGSEHPWTIAVPPSPRRRPRRLSDGPSPPRRTSRTSLERLVRAGRASVAAARCIRHAHHVLRDPVRLLLERVAGWLTVSFAWSAAPAARLARGRPARAPRRRDRHTPCRRPGRAQRPRRARGERFVRGGAAGTRRGPTSCAERAAPRQGRIVCRTGQLRELSGDSHGEVR